ncbi:TfoX/Sxy family protein [Paracoccus marinaquae]|uniref:TfoX/Sxy family protein n=1 Tax=Paracoccus marinaquae TaxID=2841926 RepID=A0ABS6AG09_9RHOB|nr:TfoX/Sxy family protein [Paracoccus marinaquae]MBU3028554.1 TfoX/Sxy family protein [Paracoccus marinaquae]
MTRDPGLEAQLAEDFGHPGSLSGRAMFGGWCFLLNGNMLGAARAGRAMFRVGRAAEADALTLPGTQPMSQGGRARPGFLWLSGPLLSDDGIRRRLAAMALAHVSTLPPKDA